MHDRLAPAAFAAIAGAVALFASAYDWEWFAAHPRAQWVPSVLGNKGARFFYAAVGIFMLFVAGAVGSGALEAALGG